MDPIGISIEKWPEKSHPFLIVGLEGWGNALDVSRAMVSYIIRKLDAKRFARIDPETYFRYDENRPWVKIDSGRLRAVYPKSGALYSATAGPDETAILILKGHEPHLRWFQFVEGVIAVCRKLDVRTVVSVGSMYDDVLHSDRMISGMASDDNLLSVLIQKSIHPITYNGPGSIHSTLHAKAQENGMNCISLWCHCPYYLQGATHFGLVSHLGSLLAYLCHFDLDVTELEGSWKEMTRQIQAQIDTNPELQAMINGLRKARIRGPLANMGISKKVNGKIIQLKDFLEPK